VLVNLTGARSPTQRRREGKKRFGGEKEFEALDGLKWFKMASEGCWFMGCGSFQFLVFSSQLSGWVWESTSDAGRVRVWVCLGVWSRYIVTTRIKPKDS
jgi:hypothetical protein